MQSTIPYTVLFMKERMQLVDAFILFGRNNGRITETASQSNMQDNAIFEQKLGKFLQLSMQKYAHQICEIAACYAKIPKEAIRKEASGVEKAGLEHMELCMAVKVLIQMCINLLCILIK